jgi:hypothetical protein
MTTDEAKLPCTEPPEEGDVNSILIQRILKRLEDKTLSIPERAQMKHMLLGLRYGTSQDQWKDKQL